MGISWSSNNNRRRNNNYLHHPPPSHQFIPSSSFIYTSEPPSLPPPPPPPPPPSSNPHPPQQQQQQQQNYMYPSNPPPYAPPPPLPHNLYPTHPPPPPPPNYSSYYYSHQYNSCNYANPMMGQSNYNPYYANQINGWTAIRPAGVPAPPPPIIPAPYVEHQNAKKVRNDVNVHKDTLRVEVDEQNPDQHVVSFVFDALFDGSITLYYFAKEESECKFVPLFPEAHMPVRIAFQKGLGQKFRQASGTGIDLGFFELDDLSKPSPGEDVFPLVIAAEACSQPDPTPTEDESDDPVPNTSANMQITQAVLEKNNSDPFRVRVIRQILWVDEVRYELREIYGIGSSTSHDFNDSDSGKECIICMTEPKDTAILPCRHMCMCSECAKELRLQSDKCPICRQPIEELIEIKINNGDQ